MAIDTEEKRMSVPGVGRPWMRTHFPTTIDKQWRSGVGLTYNAFLLFVGGKFHAADFFPTGQNDVTIILYDTADNSVESLDNSSCVEIGATGIYIWEISKITSIPTVYKEFAYKMTDGATSEGGIITFDDFLTQYIMHENMDI